MVAFSSKGESTGSGAFSGEKVAAMRPEEAKLVVMTWIPYSLKAGREGVRLK